ncbi:MAG: 4-hydroxy-tetrahydrodipicolinate synthase [Spirochaetaceae bacterium]|jgi:4-hydroxy-tetrahydrodipicolinate synthase|nr:4-hydroxy-tetrahydrodipicolinate synthase [Spirochaetaceae bacterium]
MNMLKGAITALITPMKENGDVDYDGFRRLIQFQLDEGIDGIAPLGTTGETPTLSDPEEDELIKIAVREAGGKVPVILGAGSNSTACAVRYTKRAKDLGADAALIVTPYYNKPNDDGLIRHFEAVAAVGLPVVVYNIASRTGRNIPALLMARLAEIPNIVAVKEASGDINQMGDVISAISLKKPFSVLSGDDALTLPLIALGGNGVISVISNLFPAKVKKMTALALSGDFDGARSIHYELLPFIKSAFSETNPIPIKRALMLAGLPAGPVRLPLGALSAENEALLKKTLKALGV